MIRNHVVAFTLMTFAVGALAKSDPPPKYRVAEVVSPLQAAACLPGYAVRMNSSAVGDRGVVPGNLACYGYSQVGDGVVLPTLSVNRAFVWDRANGATEVVPPPESSTPYLFSVDGSGNVYGWLGNQTGINGVRWTPGTGYETVITKSPDCFLNISFAIAGNAAGNIAGAAYRQDGVSEFPGEWTCVFRWVFRDAFGNEIVGPAQDQTPSRMNRRNVVIGQVNKSAVKWLPLKNNTLVTLDQASPGFMSYALGINDRNVIVGIAGVDSGLVGCWSDAVAMVWERDGEGRTLPSLPRMTNSEAWAVDDEGTVYGLSSMGNNICGGKRTWEDGRATLWRHDRAYDLNKLLVGSQKITLTNAVSVNSKGQILAYGFVTGAPLKDCPDVGASTEGEPYLIAGQCRDQHLYLLTPQK